MIDKAEVENIVQEFIGDTALFLVDIVVSPGNIIHVQVDRPEGISIEECVELNRFIVEKLDRETDDYELVVSSPGIGSPLKVLPQFLKNIGRTVEVLQKDGMKLKGTLLHATNNKVDVEIAKKVKMEGKKRPEIVLESVEIKIVDIKSIKVLISFK